MSQAPQTVTSNAAAAPAAAAAPQPASAAAAAAAAPASVPAPAGPAGPASAASLGAGTAAPTGSAVPSAIAGAASPGSPLPPSADAKDASEIRCLIDNHSVGCIIGKGGANVKRVRDETGISISILKADNVKAVKERVMVLKGSTVALAKALHMVAERLVESANTSESKKQNANADGKADDKETTVVRLLVHRSAVGAVIGKAGAVIKETQTETGARVQVSNDPLPQSTEKTITVTGTPASIQSALIRILNQLRDNPLKNQRVVPFVPGQQAYPQQPFGYPQQPQGYGQQQMGMYGGGYGAPQQPPQRQELAIPTHTAGGIIGKAGAVIRDLRMQSSTNISIADPEPNNPSERIVTVSGTAQGIQTAIFLIRQLVEQYQPPQAVPQQQAAAAAAAAAHPQHMQVQAQVMHPVVQGQAYAS